MPNFAIHDGAEVRNVIVAESLEMAEKVTGLSALETVGEPWIGYVMVEGTWAPPKPYESWTWDGSEWQPPVALPDDGRPYEWSELNQAWLEPA